MFTSTENNSSLHFTHKCYLFVFLKTFLSLYYIDTCRKISIMKLSTSFDDYQHMFNPFRLCTPLTPNSPQPCHNCFEVNIWLYFLIQNNIVNSLWSGGYSAQHTLEILTILQQLEREVLRCTLRPEQGGTWKKMYASRKERSSKISWEVQPREKTAIEKLPRAGMDKNN